MHRRVNRRRDRPNIQARSSLPRSSHSDRVGHPAAATAAASRIQYAASVLCGIFGRCTPQIRARIAPHCSRHIRPRHARQREGNENSVPRPFVCAGLFAHEKEEVRRKETDQQPSLRRRVVREARLSGATARQKGVMAENVHDAEGEDAYPMLLQPAAPA